MTDAINEIVQTSELALSNGDRLLQVSLIAIAGGVGFLGGVVIIPALKFLFIWYSPKFLTETYSRIAIASKSVVLALITLSAMEVTLLLIPETEWLSFIEFCLSVSITLLSGWLLSKLFRDFFDTKILGITFASNPKVRGESIFLLRYLGDFAIAIALILFFCIIHDINVVGIAASLGIGGIAIAFAAQKTLEQFLGGIVLTLDRPFTVGDYIGLSDGQQGKQGTFGRVESIGLRST